MLQRQIKSHRWSDAVTFPRQSVGTSFEPTLPDTILEAHHDAPRHSVSDRLCPMGTA